MGYGGVNVGYHNGLGVVSWGFGSGFGVGGLSDRSLDVGRYDALFLYAKPEVRVGFNLVVTGLELALHVLTPLNVAQWVPSGDGRGLVHPTIGFEARFLFGRLFVGPSRRDRDDSAPLAIPGPSTPPPSPPPEGALALPADASGYPAPPPPMDEGSSGDVLPDDAPLAIPADPG
jgi:hypothetical protein